MHRHTVVQIGLGPRGTSHLEEFIRNSDRFDLVGICDLSQECVNQVGECCHISKEKRYQNAEEMMCQCKPDILSFATMPGRRIEFIQLGVKHHVKGILLEKPLALTINEAHEIYTLCRDNHIKAVVCHQHKYLDSFLKLGAILNSGELGKIYKIDAACQAQMAQLGTHYIDYIIWANGGVGVESVVGHIHGRDMLGDSHPSPDYCLGNFIMKNGVRAQIECGYLAKAHAQHGTDYENKIFPGAY